MTSQPAIEPLQAADEVPWRALWAGYLAFYGRPSTREEGRLSLA